MLLPERQRPRISPALFDLDRYQRFGVLGLLDHDPVGDGWFWSVHGALQVEVIAVGSADSGERRGRLLALLAQLIDPAQGGEDASGSPLRSRFHRDAGEGADHPQSARRHHAVC